MLLIVVNARVVGLLVGSTMVASGAGFDWAIGCGLAIGLFSAAFIVYGGVGFRTAWKNYVPRRPRPAGTDS